MRRLLLALPFVAVILIAAVGPLTTTTAMTIAVIVMAVAPFVLKFVPLDGPKMVLLSYLVAAVVTVVAGFASGEVTTASFNIANLVATSGALWAVMQGVFQLFKTNKTFGAHLT